MARVLLAWELGGGTGHCVKLAPIAEGLIDRGHEVWIAARDLTTARQILGGTRVGYFQAPYLPGKSFGPPARSFVDVLSNTGFGDITALDVLCAAWRNLFASIQPEMLICDHAPTALLASRWQAMRRVILGTGFTVPPPISPLPDLRYWFPAATAEADLRHDEDAVLRRVNDLLEKDGLNPLGRLAELFVDVDLSFLLTFRELDHYPQREAARYWGAWGCAGGCAPDWPANGPRLFAYLKPPSTTWRLAEFLAFLRESRLSSIVYVPGGNSEWLRRFESSHLQFVDGPVNIAHAANCCDAAILHGTAGSVTAFLLAGVPQLNVPLYLEQLILSQRVADLGAGLYANPTRPEQVATQLMALLKDARYHQAAKSFSQRHAAFDAADLKERVVSIIHQQLGDQKNP